ncbi:MAG: metallophosphoesterase [Alphaproteobacteria bacterium]|nr:MAG: metallophosphoesterase [Alphaproteobacteria bacterium]
MSDRDKFAVLRRCRRTWTVAAIHGEADRLEALHRELDARFRPGDRLVYLGNYLGRGPAVARTMDALLDFRRALIARPGMFASDVAYLRGSQEEMWQKLLQLQFAPNPREVLDWMLAQGVGATLAAYGGDPVQGASCAREGALSLTKWTSGLRAAMQSRPGHYLLMSALRRAAYTDDGALLFVHAGLDPARPLSAQSDSLWWGAGGFARMAEPYGSFAKVVRGFDRAHPGLEIGSFTATIDAGCGFGGPLLAACLDPLGEVVEAIEA